MNNRSDDKILDALIAKASEMSYAELMAGIPSDEELREMYSDTSALDKRIYSIIDSSFTAGKRKRRLKSFRRVAAAITIVLAVSSTMLMSVEATRNIIFGAIREITGGVINFTYGDSVVTSPLDLRMGYIPEGYVELEVYEFGSSLEITYVNGEGKKIIFERMPIEGTSLMMDLDNHDYEIYNSLYGEAYLFKASSKLLTSSIIFYIDDYIFTLTANFSAYDMIQIVNGIE